MMKKHRIELENGLVLSIRNTEDEVVITWVEGSVNVLDLHTSFDLVEGHGSKASNGQMVLDTIPNNRFELDQSGTEDMPLTNMAEAKAYIDKVVRRTVENFDPQGNRRTE
jgi:hypothetical protein